MKAIFQTNYGPPDILEIKDVPKPTPKDDEVLVKIHASSVNYGNLVLMKGEPFLARFAFGLLKPKFPIPGGDIAGQIEAVGKDVKGFQQGDEVFGDLSLYGWGAFADYVSVPEKAIARKPGNITYEEAASVPMAAVTALQALRDKGKIQAGQKVLIHGASGGVGTFAVQIAKALHAEVTAVCSIRNVDIVRSIGADFVIDYTKEDVTKRAEMYDLIVSVNGYHPISAYKQLLRPNGTYIVIGGSGKQLFEVILLGPWISLLGDKKMHSFLQRANQADLIFMAELLESGKVRPVIEKNYKLSEVADALRLLEEGHAQGKIVITM